MEFSSAEKENVLSFLRQLPESLGSDWRKNKDTAVFARLIPDAIALPSNLKHALIVPMAGSVRCPSTWFPLKAAPAIC